MTDREMMMYDYVVECGVCTAEELNLVKNIKGGTWEEVINLVIDVRTGYHDFDQWIEAEAEEE